MFYRSQVSLSHRRYRNQRGIQFQHEAKFTQAAFLAAQNSPPLYNARPLSDLSVCPVGRCRKTSYFYERPGPARADSILNRRSVSDSRLSISLRTISGSARAVTRAYPLAVFFTSNEKCRLGPFFCRSRLVPRAGP